MNRTIIIACWVVLLGTASALIWLLWSLLWPFNLLESEPGAWDIVNKDKTVHQGEYAMVKWRGCRNTDLPASLDTELQGTIVISLPGRVSTRHPGCQAVDFPIAYIGPEIPPGDYKARMIITFTVNPIRTVKYIAETDEFHVVRGPE